MPNVNTVNFGPGQANVDLQAQQVQLQRQQQLADMLRQQAATPMETQMVSGRAVKNSPLLGVAQLAKALLANRMQDKNDAKQTELGNVAAQRSATALRALAPAGMFDSAPGAAQAGPLSDEPMGEPGASPAQNAPPPQPAGPKVDPALREKWARALTLYQSNPELGGKLIQNLAELTGNQKDWNAQGVDPHALGAAMLKKEQAGGLVNVAPNNTVLDAGTGKPMYAAPDFKSGMNNSFGPDGQPRIGMMQGAEAIPQMAGQVKAAESAAQAGQDMVTVNTPQGGPQMMTRAQAVQLSSGAPPPPQPQPGQPAPPQAPGASQNQGFPPGTQMPAPTPGMQSRTEILKQELAAAQADPRRAGDIPAIQRELAGAGKTGSMPGIPLQTDAQREQQVGDVKLQQDVRKARLLQAQSPEEIQKLTDAGSLLELLNTANDILSQGKATGSTVGHIRDKIGNAVGISTPASQASAQLAAIGGALVAKVPKMSGPTSNYDAEMYKETAGKIGDASIPIADRMAALKVNRAIAEKYLKQNENSVAAEALGENKRNGPIRKYNPATGKIE